MENREAIMVNGSVRMKPLHVFYFHFSQYLK